MNGTGNAILRLFGHKPAGVLAFLRIVIGRYQRRRRPFALGKSRGLQGMFQLRYRLAAILRITTQFKQAN